MVDYETAARAADGATGFKVAGPGGSTLRADLERGADGARCTVTLARPGQGEPQRLVEAWLAEGDAGSWVRAGAGPRARCALGVHADWSAQAARREYLDQFGWPNAAVALDGRHFLVAYAHRTGRGGLYADVSVAGDSPSIEGQLWLPLAGLDVGEGGAVVQAFAGRPRAAQAAWLDICGRDSKALSPVASYEADGLRAELSEVAAAWNPYDATMLELELTDLETGASAHIANAPVRAEAGLRAWVDSGRAWAWLNAENRCLC